MTKAVAVIDDDPGILRSIGRLLEAYGYVPFEFESAEAFLDQQAKPAVACLILDIHLNGISGIELGRRLAADGDDTPLIFISATNDPATQYDAREIGCVALLHKPFVASFLVDAIEKASTITLIGECGSAIGDVKPNDMRSRAPCHQTKRSS